MSINDLEKVLVSYGNAAKTAQEKEIEKKETKNKLLERFKVFMNENIKPIMKQYGEKLKEHGHDYKIDVKSNSIEMQILPDIVKRESYSLGSDDKNAHIGFYFKEGEIRVSSLTIVPAVSSGSGGVRKTFKDIDEISDKEINIIINKRNH